MFLQFCFYQNKSYCAIQKYKEALQIDFTYLQPLYNISLEYRKMCLYDAELESLNLMTIVSMLPVVIYKLHVKTELQYISLATF